jgi:hypothetical protein
MDDAHVDGHVHLIAFKVAGTVKALYITDNQYVKKAISCLKLIPPLTWSGHRKPWRVMGESKK